MSTFQELRIVDNFYQTSLFYPMPAVLVSTLTDDGKTTCGPYSLLSPFYVAGKPYYAFMLECRNSSNTAQNLIKHKKCVINFLPDDRKSFKEMVRLGWPGDTPAEKMKDFRFHLEDGLRKAEDPEGTYPQVITEAVQAVIRLIGALRKVALQKIGPVPVDGDRAAPAVGRNIVGIGEPLRRSGPGGDGGGTLRARFSLLPTAALLMAAGGKGQYQCHDGHNNK